MTKQKIPFWKRKSLSEMTTEEWEALCDGCGLCCLHKLEDADTGEIAYTDVACRLLDIKSCRCKNYEKRKNLVPDCVILKPEYVDQFKWLPETCAYRLISENKDLFPWHHLISGDRETIHKIGVSVINKVISERDAGDLEDHIINLKEFSHG
ncbi:MAG: YcgN family cysteine cluster protein [Emcibacteraceae bacterium]